MNVKPVALPVFISRTGKPCLLPLELKIDIEWTIFTEYNHHEQNGNWNINSRVIQRRWQRFTCIQESIRQGGLESDVTHGQRSPHRVVEGVPGVVRVQLVLRGFEERQYVLPTPTSISFEMRTIFGGCHSSPNHDTRVVHLVLKSALMVDHSSLNYVRAGKHDWVSPQSKKTKNTKICHLGYYRQRDYLFLYLGCLCAPKHRSPHDLLWRTTSRSQWTHRPPPGQRRTIIISTNITIIIIVTNHD